MLYLLIAAQLTLPPRVQACVNHTQNYFPETDSRNIRIALCQSVVERNDLNETLMVCNEALAEPCPDFKPEVERKNKWWVVPAIVGGILLGGLAGFGVGSAL